MKVKILQGGLKVIMFSFSLFLFLVASFAIVVSIIWLIIFFVQKKNKKKPLVSLMISFGAVVVSFALAASSSSRTYTEEDIQSIQAEIADYSNKLDELQNSYNELEKEKESIEAEYDEYKESMSTYEGLSEAEAEARRIEAESIAESKAIAESQAEAESIAAKEAEEKMGYETGITYDQLARTPDNYIGDKVKFTGNVVQVLEADDYVQIRLAVNGNYDTILLGEYEKDIVSSRVLENDKITIYGTSLGVISYESTLGATITIPGVLIDKIDQ